MLGRLLLVFMLVPVMVLGSQGTAAAASFGEVVGWSVAGSSGGSIRGADKVSCNGTSVYASDNGANVQGQVRCSIDSPFTADPGVGEISGTTSLYFMGANAEGHVEGCEAAATSSADPIAGFTYASAALGVGCVVSEMCFTASWVKVTAFSSDSTYSFEDCITLNLGDLPEEDTGGDCVYGNPTYAAVKETPWGSYPTAGGYHTHEVSMRVDDFVVGSSATVDPYWDVRMYFRNTTSGAITQYVGAQLTPPQQGGAGTWAGGLWKAEQVQLESFAQNSHAGWEGGKVIGMQVQGVRMPNASPVLDGRVGTTQASGCRFWFGPKIVFTSDNDLDEPHSNLDTPIEPTSSEPPDMTPTAPATPAASCDFVLSDPTTWLSGGMCAVVGLLAALLDSIDDLLSVIGRLVGELVDAIKGLFWPEGGLRLRERVNAMSDAFDGRFPFSIPGDIVGLGSAGSEAGFTPSSGGAGAAWGSNSCPDWTIDLPGADADQNVVCDSSFTAAIRGARGVILGAFLLLAFWPLIRSVFYASFPIVKPSPSNTSEK